MEGGGGRLSLVDEAFENFEGSRNGIIIALTTGSEEFYRQCDPERESLCLLGLSSGDWQVSPPGDVPSKLPLKALTYQEMGPQKRAGCAQLPRTVIHGYLHWLSILLLDLPWTKLTDIVYVIVKFVIFELWETRQRLFTMINGLPTVYEVVKEATEKQPMLKPSTRGKNPNEGNPKNNIEDEELDDDEVNEVDGDNLCGICLKKDASYRFWICCDVCDKWFHGKCVGITEASAKHIDKYMCPLCKRRKRAPP
ncbi:Alfin [Trema orientale]|uniref:PHD finger protein ALFIN-LIKE n=1 Tax=Trema orientale TaxID=63057 RepID=A0A2P5BH00_TREOI|nr:Alfin [Trema orientale]